MSKEEIQQISFQLIGYAGDAFSNFYSAVESAKKGEFEKTENLLKEGEQQLTKAHQSQTELLVAEANGEQMEFSVILVHAQDHLMMTIMYERIAKEFIELYRERRKGDE